MNESARRILYVHNSADLYGASRSLCRLMSVLDRQRFEPLVVLPEAGPLAKGLEKLGVRVLVEPSLAIVSRYTSFVRTLLIHFPVSTWRITRLIRRERVALVHTNVGVIFSPAVSARLARVPHVWHIRESFEEFCGGMWAVYAAYMRGFSARIISVSSANAAQFPDQRNVEVIHNGFAAADFTVPDDSARRAARQQFGVSAAEFVTGCVGRIKLVRKGQEYLIQAAHFLKQRGWNMKHLIVGSPYRGNESHLERLSALVHDLELDGDVIFTGELQDTKAAYAAMDVFVLPSAQSEPFGGVVMEAMAYALPVIATSIGGSLDQVEDGVTGFLVPPADPAALAEKIEQLARDGQRGKAMGRAGRARLAEKFDLQRMARRVEALYDELLPVKG